MRLGRQILRKQVRRTGETWEWWESGREREVSFPLGRCIDRSLAILSRESSFPIPLTFFLKTMITVWQSTHSRSCRVVDRSLCGVIPGSLCYILYSFVISIICIDSVFRLTLRVFLWIEFHLSCLLQLFDGNWTRHCIVRKWYSKHRSAISSVYSLSVSCSVKRTDNKLREPLISKHRAMFSSQHFSLSLITQKKRESIVKWERHNKRSVHRVISVVIAESASPSKWT